MSDLGQTFEEIIKRTVQNTLLERDLPDSEYVATDNLGEGCDLIVGKNSGPFCFCETGRNYSTPNKKFLSFNVPWGVGTLESESMSFDLPLACDYHRVSISSVEHITDNEMKLIYNNLKTLITDL